MVEAVWAESTSEPETPQKRTSLRPDRPAALVSPSVGRRMKGQRSLNGKHVSCETFVVTSLLETIKMEQQNV